MVAVSLKKFFFKQKTAYEMCPCDWSSDVCSSDLRYLQGAHELIIKEETHMDSCRYLGRRYPATLGQLNLQKAPSDLHQVVAVISFL